MNNPLRCAAIFFPLTIASIIASAAPTRLRSTSGPTPPASLRQTTTSISNPAPPGSTQPGATATTIDQVKAAFTSSATIGTITLDGTFTSIEGSLRQEGAAHLVAHSDGTYSVSLSKSTGATGEQRSSTDSGVSCSWTDSGGTAHQVDSFNCQSPAWFLPELPLLSASQSEWALSSQTSDGSSSHLIFSYSLPSAGGQSTPPVQAIDIELSSGTLFPVKADFSIHPDGQSYVNIPVEVTYQDYRQVSGVNIPFHIQKFVNGSLVLDITVSSANVN